MPEVRGDQLDVSAEEQRYLRRIFRRFALPYVLMGFALGASTALVPLWIEARPEQPEGVEDPHLREEIASLRSELAALSQRTVGAEAALAKTRERVAALEGQSGPVNEEPVDVEEIGHRFDARVDAIATRIEALEARTEAGTRPGADTAHLEEQVATLGSRLVRLEGELDGLRQQAPAGLAR